jgi:hypothetical protein
MSLKLLPYEKRIVEKLPPISMIHIEYLKLKYRHQILRAVACINREIKESESLDHDYFSFEMLNNMVWDDNRYKILTIDGYERWLIEKLQWGLKGFDKSRTGRLIRKEITGGRMYRSRIFDLINDKYFEICVEKLLIAGVGNPHEKAHNAFEDAEVWHIDFEEDEDGFLCGVKNVLDVYCQTEKRPKINLKIIQPIQIIV